MPDIPAIYALHEACAAPVQCPICSGMNCWGCQTFCLHWVGSTEFDACTTLAEQVPDFTEAVGQLVGLIDEWGTPLIARLIVRHDAPTYLRHVIWASLEDREYWLTYYRDLRVIFWARQERPAGEGCGCFHPHPRAFARRVRDDAERACQWLIAYLPASNEEDRGWTDDDEAEYEQEE
ncbi:MAG TPA: hypothetical protein VHN13_04715 [Candidatus Tectomicrobia bacterium]|nr:hypothetical protein [Candidatus Tectomicrobia bacterium]